MKLCFSSACILLLRSAFSSSSPKLFRSASFSFSSSVFGGGASAAAFAAEASLAAVSFFTARRSSTDMVAQFWNKNLSDLDNHVVVGVRVCSPEVTQPHRWNLTAVCHSPFLGK